MKNRNIFCYIFTFLIIQFFALPAHSVCTGLTVSITSSSSFNGSGTGYLVYDPSEYMQTVNFSVSKTAHVANCNYFVTLSPGQSANPAQRTMSASTSMNYNVYVNSGKSNILKDCATAVAAEVISGSFPVLEVGAGTNNHSFYWTANPEQVKNPATYSDNSLTVSVYNGAFSGLVCALAPADTKTITFQTPVQSSVDLSLVGTGSGFNISDNAETLNFGTLSTSEQQSFDLVIRSNDGYLTTLQSNNGQVLRHSNHPTISSTINYSLTFNGGAVNLSSGNPVQVTSNSGGTTTSAGVSFPIQTTIGTINNTLAAGTYSDVIAVSVSAH